MIWLWNKFLSIYQIYKRNWPTTSKPLSIYSQYNKTKSQ